MRDGLLRVSACVRAIRSRSAARAHTRACVRACVRACGWEGGVGVGVRYIITRRLGRLQAWGGAAAGRGGLHGGGASGRRAGRRRLPTGNSSKRTHRFPNGVCGPEWDGGTAVGAHCLLASEQAAAAFL